MRGLGQRLRDRARHLGLSDAEVARRAGLGERRYANYVAELREPDLTTLVKICGVLDITPNDALLPQAWRVSLRGGNRERLLARLAASTNALSDLDLQLAVDQVAAMVRHRSSSARQKARR